MSKKKKKKKLQDGAQLNISVVDRDVEPGEFADLIDYFSIPLNISASSSVTNNFTGRYNYIQLELTIEVRCIGVAGNIDESQCMLTWIHWAIM